MSNFSPSSYQLHTRTDLTDGQSCSLLRSLLSLCGYTYNLFGGGETIKKRITKWLSPSLTRNQPAQKQDVELPFPIGSAKTRDVQRWPSEGNLGSTISLSASKRPPVPAASVTTYSHPILNHLFVRNLKFGSKEGVKTSCIGPKMWKEQDIRQKKTLSDKPALILQPYFKY